MRLRHPRRRAAHARRARLRAAAGSNAPHRRRQLMKYSWFTISTRSPAVKMWCFNRKRPCWRRMDTRWCATPTSNDDRAQYSLATLRAKTIWNGAVAQRSAGADPPHASRPDARAQHVSADIALDLQRGAGEGVPVVQTLHNFRLLCPKATLLPRRRRVRGLHRHDYAWPGVVHGCYRGSRAATGGHRAMLTTHSCSAPGARKSTVHRPYPSSPRTSSSRAGGRPTGFREAELPARRPGHGDGAGRLCAVRGPALARRRA